MRLPGSSNGEIIGNSDSVPETISISHISPKLNLVDTISNFLTIAIFVTVNIQEWVVRNFQTGLLMSSLHANFHLSSGSFVIAINKRYIRGCHSIVSQSTTIVTRMIFDRDILAHNQVLTSTYSRRRLHVKTLTTPCIFKVL